MKLTISEEYDGQRLDIVVASLFPRLSRAFVQKLCDQELVTVNGKPEKPGKKLKLGEKLEVTYDPSELDHIPVTDVPVIYEDEDCVVFNKPVGMLTHAQGALRPEATVASFLRTKTAQAINSQANDRAGIVHRLDRATSGVIIGAKNQAALSFLQKQFSQRKVKKTYVAIVSGHLKDEEAIIDIPIERNPKAPASFRTGPNGKSAITHYKVLQEGKSATLVELKPETGRTHQIRVHMRHTGHPIIGDPIYGTGTYTDRLYLHALSLEITLPNRERKVFTAPLPSEFKDYMAQA